MRKAFVAVLLLALAPAAIAADAKGWKNHHEQAVLYHKQGDYRAADVDFTKAIELRGHPDDYWWRAKNRRDLIASVIKKHPNTPLDAAALQAVLDDYTSAIRLNPKDVTYYAMRAEIYYWMKKPAESRADMEKARANGLTKKLYFEDKIQG